MSKTSLSLALISAAAASHCDKPTTVRGDEWRMCHTWDANCKETLATIPSEQSVLMVCPDHGEWKDVTTKPHELLFKCDGGAWKYEGHVKENTAEIFLQMEKGRSPCSRGPPPPPERCEIPYQTGVRACKKWDKGCIEHGDHREWGHSPVNHHAEFVCESGEWNNIDSSTTKYGKSVVELYCQWNGSWSHPEILNAMRINGCRQNPPPHKSCSNPEVPGVRVCPKSPEWKRDVCVKYGSYAEKYSASTGDSYFVCEKSNFDNIHREFKHWIDNKEVVELRCNENGSWAHPEILNAMRSSGCSANPPPPTKGCRSPFQRGVSVCPNVPISQRDECIKTGAHQEQDIAPAGNTAYFVCRGGNWDTIGIPQKQFLDGHWAIAMDCKEDGNWADYKKLALMKRSKCTGSNGGGSGPLYRELEDVTDNTVIV